MKILVTGCAGFIGFHLAKKLLSNKKYLVFGIDNINNYYDTELKKKRLSLLKKFKNFKFFKLDICNEEKIFLNFKKNKYQYVLHFAAQAGVRMSFNEPDKYFKTNVEGFFNIIDSSRRINVKHFLFASTSSVYGNSKVFPVKENFNTENHESFYASTKKTNELIAQNYSSIFNLKSTCLRIFTVYGPYGRPDMALFKFTKNILNSNELEIYNSGNHFRDFTYIDDAVNMITKLIKKIPSNVNSYDVFNIASGKSISLKLFINTIAKSLDKKIYIKKLGKQKGDVVKTHADIKKISKKINLNNLTSLQNGIELFTAWYKKYYK